MKTRPYQRSDLEHGKLVKDLISGDLGVLTSRFDIMKDWGEHQPIWVWEIYWAGPSTDEDNRVVPFIEHSILGLLNGGVWLLMES
jgi:hypothetical protein